MLECLIELFILKGFISNFFYLTKCFRKSKMNYNYWELKYNFIIILSYNFIKS